MTAIDRVTKSICKDLLLDTYAINQELLIASKSQYPNGDHICAYWISGETNAFTDHGCTLNMIDSASRHLTDTRRDTVNRILQHHGMSLVGNALVKPITQSIGKAFIDFCDAVGRIASCVYDIHSSADNALKYRLSTILKSPELANWQVHQPWYYSDIDPDRLWPVEWRITDHSRERHFFTVHSSSRVNSVAAVVNYLRSNEIVVPTMVLLERADAIGRKGVRRLQQISDELVFEGSVVDQSRIFDWIQAA
jgi:hypothetical protein